MSYVFRSPERRPDRVPFSADDLERFRPPDIRIPHPRCVYVLDDRPGRWDDPDRLRLTNSETRFPSRLGDTGRPLGSD